MPFDVLARRAWSVLDNIKGYLLVAEEHTGDE
jgi:hypothetical protein